MLLSLRFHTRYTYEPAVAAGLTALRLAPVNQPGLVVHESRLNVFPGRVSETYVDAWGTRVDMVEFLHPHAAATFDLSAMVETSTPEAPGLIRPSEAFLFRQDSRRVQRRDLVGLESLPTAGTGWADVERLAAWVPGRFRYDVRATDDCTPMHEFIAAGAGVCQDFAHLMLAIVRSWGWPARYVSGYFFSSAASAGRIDAEATHAWVEVWNASGWVGFDPTAGALADERYVPIARGRDYDDVRPVQGVLQGTAHQEYTSRLSIHSIAQQQQ
jgi:transglutaminase-like putative cysteine protease